jgi:predicted metal-dependent RNase
MKGSIIMARENWPGAPVKEVCRCNGFAEDIRNALADYTVTGSQGTRIHKYNLVEIVDVSRRRQKEASAQMKKPIKNIDDFSGKPSANQIAYVLEQVDAMRAANGEQAAQGPAEEARPPLPQRQSEAEQP